MTGNHQPLNTLPDGQSVSLSEAQDSYCVEVSSGVVEVVRETNQFWRLTQMTALNTEQLSAFAILFSANPEIRTIELGQFKSEVLDSLCFETAEGLKVLWREAVMQTPDLWLKTRIITFTRTSKSSTQQGITQPDQSPYWVSCIAVIFPILTPCSL